MRRHELSGRRLARFMLPLAGAFLLGLPGFASADPQVSTATESSDGLKRAVFTLPQGTIRANLPDDMAAGDTLSGTVSAEPAGSDSSEKEANGATLSGYVIEAENRKTAVRDRIAVWSIPATETIVTLVLRDPGGREVAHTQLPLSPGVPIVTNTPPSTEDFQTPAFGNAGAPATVTGPFTGDSRNTSVSIAGKETEILAESPRKAIYLVPSHFFGPGEVQVRERDLPSPRRS